MKIKNIFRKGSLWHGLLLSAVLILPNACTNLSHVQKDDILNAPARSTSIDGLKAKQIIVAMDSCFSGAGGRSVLAKGTRPLITKVDTGTNNLGRVIALSASDGDRISGTIEDQGHGAFTYYLLKGLNGAAADKNGNITVKALYDYILPNVQNAARRSNRDQIPQLHLENLSEEASVKLR